MTKGPPKSWSDELGIEDWLPPKFFRNAEEVDKADAAPAQAHLLRRAFERLKLSGIVCFQNAPVIYFKEVTRDERADADTIHRIFWYQGLAPILVLIDPDEVRIYSGMSLPVSQDSIDKNSNRLVAVLDRVVKAAELRRLILSVESGEFFRANAKSFNPKQRVDQDLLTNLGKTRAALESATKGDANSQFLDALLCRIVFVSYLFDRNVIGKSYLTALGIHGSHLRDVLGGMDAKAELYDLFKQLGKDFNGDLFDDDLDDECEYVTDRHLLILKRFVNGTDVITGQPSFWPYEFGIIPIETLSAIYEHFLKAEDADGKRKSGAFYTPRFLAEVTLDIALDGVGSLLDKRFLDPACGSGIFLVGIFNRIAEEWKRRNPTAGYSRRATALISILRENIFGVDIKATACRIAAFSLYLAFLDQLAPPAIQELQRKGKFLPLLVCPESSEPCEAEGHTIRCGDFFKTAIPEDFDVIVGNPPWGKVDGPLSTGELWCESADLPIANRQLAIGFLWKAGRHQSPEGRICFILPAMLLFNHHDSAVRFQSAWLQSTSLEVALNLADMRFNLFSEATGPSLVVRYKNTPAHPNHKVTYLVPKTSWPISQAEIITILPEDRTEFYLSEAIDDAKLNKPPRALKERFWGSPRDWKLIDRLAGLPPLSGIVGQTRERRTKRWVMAEGFKPQLADDKTENPVARPWPDDHLMLEARPKKANLFVLESDCKQIGDEYEWLHRTISASEIFEPPHVLVWYGMRIAFADFPVLFRHAIRGIHGPSEDRSLLMFLAAYLRSPLARYFLFHTSANWGVERVQVHLEEVLSVPFPLPEQTRNPSLSKRLVEQGADLFARAIKDASKLVSNRPSIVRATQSEFDSLIYQYFDIDDHERMLVEDTDKVVIPSILPHSASTDLPTLKVSTAASRRAYADLLCEILNDWAARGRYHLYATISALPDSGVGAIAVHRSHSAVPKRASEEKDDLIPILDRLQKAFKRQLSSVEILHGIKIIHGETLYLLKPLCQRFWTNTAALNDADDIATTILAAKRKEAV